MALRKISLHIRKATSSLVSIQYLFPITEFLHFTIRFKDGGCLKGWGEWGHGRDRTSSISFQYKSRTWSVNTFLINFIKNQYFKRTFVLWCRILQKKAYIHLLVHEPYICLFRLKLLFSDLSLLQFPVYFILPEVDAVSVRGECEAREFMQKTQLIGKVECWGCGLGPIRRTERDLNNKRL